MQISYAILSKKDRIFRKLTGLKLKHFNKILTNASKSLDEGFPRIGRKPKVDNHADRLLLVLIYYRCYMTQEFLGYLIGLDESNVNRLIRRVELLLVKEIISYK